MSYGPARCQVWQHAAMPQRNLGGLVTSAIGLGCMGLSQGYGPADDADSVRAIPGLSTWA